MSRTPTLPEILNRIRDLTSADIRVALPGQIVRWDSATQLADVKPQITEQIENEDGTATEVPLPVISNVPVQFPGAGGMRITFPVQIGDTCLLIFADRPVDGWQDQGGVSAPQDARRHALTDAFALLGYHPNTAAWQGVDSATITLGQDGAAAEFVATAERVRKQFQALKDAVNSWIVVPNDGGAALKAALSMLFLTWPTAPASNSVKILG